MFCFFVFYTSVNVSGYVQNISPLKRSKKNVEYFTAVLQNQEQSYDKLVCFSPTKKAKLEKASLEKSPIKIEGVKRSLSKFKPFDNEILVGEENVVTDTKLDYPFSLYQEVEDSPMMKVGDLSKCRDREKVSVNVFVKVSTFPAVKVNLSYLSHPISKKEACANDITGTIPIVLWDKHVEHVSEDGTFLVKNAVFRRYRNQQVQLTTNTSTVFEKSTNEIDQPNTIPFELTTSKFQLPPSIVTILPIKFFCMKCKSFTSNKSENTMLFNCSECNSTCISNKVNRKVEAKIQFSSPSVTIFVSSPQLEEFFNRDKKCVPMTIDEISIALLQDTSFVVVDSRMNCIGFE